ncbi:MAG: response regulator [Candidatus Omnitrophota bacterium]
MDKEKYDIILCDIHMRGLSGKDIYGKIRQKDVALAGRIIFLTGNAVEEETQEFLEEAGNKYLQKPFEKKDLASSIESLIEREPE